MSSGHISQGPQKELCCQPVRSNVDGTVMAVVNMSTPLSRTRLVSHTHCGLEGVWAENAEPQLYTAIQQRMWVHSNCIHRVCCGVWE